MVSIVKVGQSGQITLPATLRREMGIEPGSYIVIETLGEHVLVKKGELWMQEIGKILGEEVKGKATKRKLTKMLTKAEEKVYK